MVVFLVIVALLGWLGGSLLLSQATYGVGVMAAACLFAILARIAQAGKQHREMLTMVRTLDARLQSGPSQEPVPQITAPADAWFCFRCGQNVSSKFDNCTACGLARPGG